VFEYSGLGVEDFQAVLQRYLFEGALNSMKCLLETPKGSMAPNTSGLLKVLVPDTVGEDVVFVIHVGWEPWWRIANNVKFGSSRVQPIPYYLN
jgi:DNA topoisomerase VI subunit A